MSGVPYVIKSIYGLEFPGTPEEEIPEGETA